jgi:hypothetical protein
LTEAAAELKELMQCKQKLCARVLGVVVLLGWAD